MTTDLSAWSDLIGQLRTVGRQLREEAAGLFAAGPWWAFPPNWIEWALCKWEQRHG